LEGDSLDHSSYTPLENINDYRARYTVETIQREFLKLRQEKPLGKITVKELCTRAHINRSTFYKHYEDIYFLEGAMREQLKQLLLGKLSGQSIDDVETLTTQILREVRAVGKDYWALFQSEEGGSLAEEMFLLCYEKSYPVLRKNLTDLSEEQTAYIYDYISAGSGAIIRRWISGKMKEPEELISKRIYTCVKGSLRAAGNKDF